LYLLDTNIVSANAPAKRRVGSEAFAAWIREHSKRLYISTVTVAEIEAGIARAFRIHATTKAERLRHWLAAVEQFYAGRVLSFGVEEARQAGAILDRARAHRPGFEDIAIAATASAHGFTVLTANERHFAPLGVPLINPLNQLPSGR
jgi:predicted nucleic acid-binding protein